MKKNLSSKKSNASYINFIIFSSRAGVSRQFSLSRRMLQVCGIFGVLWLFILVIFSVRFVQLRSTAVAINRLQNENESLRNESNMLSMRLKKIQVSLRDIDELSNRLRAVANGDSSVPRKKLNKGAEVNGNQHSDRTFLLPTPVPFDTLADLSLPAIGPLPAEEFALGNYASSVFHTAAEASLQVSEVNAGAILPDSSLGSLNADALIFRETFKILNDVTLQASDQSVRLRKTLLELLTFRDRLAVTPTFAPSSGRISSLFGSRLGPFSGQNQMHWGMDISNAIGTEIHAAAKGKIIEALWTDDYGHHVAIDHGHGLVTRYGHMSQILVNLDEEVEKGTLIGLMGNSGRSTGPHLHYEIIRNGQRIDPLDFIQTW